VVAEEVPAEDNLSGEVAARKLEGAAVVKAGPAEADKLGNMAVANSNKAAVVVDTADVYQEVRTIYNNRNQTPNTSPHRLVSKPIGNIRRTTGRRRLRSA